MHTITRSLGLPTGYLGLMAGGGHTGATVDLDAAVVRAAELLRDHYGQDVVIRFNSDRKSGGAWLKTHKVDGFGCNADIGITVSHWVVEELRDLYRRIPDPENTIEDRLKHDGHDPENPPESYLTFAIKVEPHRLRKYAGIETSALTPSLWEIVVSPEAGMARLAKITLKHPRKN